MENIHEIVYVLSILVMIVCTFLAFKVHNPAYVGIACVVIVKLLALLEKFITKGA